MSTTSRATSTIALDLAQTTEQIARLRREVEKVIVGQASVIDQMLTALIAGGHCLLIGVPGLAKTIMARSLANALNMQFSRVQFTPDLMPSDITGTNVLEEDPQTGRKTFRFLTGPVFTNVLLADEINRTPPKTQAALLEAMQERCVTYGNEQRALPNPFFVIATQNPLEQEGTYPLPEAQLDRFMFAVAIDYPSHSEENQIIEATTRGTRPTITSTLSAEQVLAMQKLVLHTPAPPTVVHYAVDLARATRPVDPRAADFIKTYVDTGAGPRAGQYLVLAAKSRALMAGRKTPTIDDVRASAIPVLRHRTFTNFTALSENITSDDLIRQLLEKISPPAEAPQIVYDLPTVEEPADPTVLGEDSGLQLIRRMKSVTQHLRAEVQQTIIGQTEVLDLVLTALLAGGHCLLVGVPGLAKTTLVKTIANVLDLTFKRVQFTPDLMPSDITGTDVMEVDQETNRRAFRFIPGAVFTNLLLADEINRTPPKTQAALLEAMQELAVTSGGSTYTLEPPFLVLATQNPLEQEGTYPLPEAQLDRFMFEIHMDYPTDHDERIIVDRTTGIVDRLPRKVMGGDEILKLQQVVRDVPVSRHVLTYVTTLVRMTRPQTQDCSKPIKDFVHCGAGPRAGQCLVLAAKARAVMHGRLNVSIADVMAVAVPVLRHRIFTNFSADAEGITPFNLVRDLLKFVAEPTVKQENKLEREAKVGESKLIAPPQQKPPPSVETPRIVTHCPACGKTLLVPREAAGQHARCRHCSEVFPVEQ